MPFDITNKSIIIYLVASNGSKPAEQMQELTQFANERRLKIIQTYTDTLSVDGRFPLLEKVLYNAKRKNFDALLVWSKDQLLQIPERISSRFTEELFPCVRIIDYSEETSVKSKQVRPQPKPPRPKRKLETPYSVMHGKHGFKKPELVRPDDRTMLPVSWYVRHSKQIIQQDDCISQVNLLSEKLSLNIVQTFFEAKVGKHDDRPAFNKLLLLIKSQVVKAVVVFKLEHIARSMDELREVLRELRLNNVSLISIEDGIDTTDNAQVRALYSVMDMLYQFDKDTTNQTISSGMFRAKEMGKRLGRPPISEARISEIRTLHEGGLTPVQIATKLHTSLKTVKKYLS